MTVNYYNKFNATNSPVIAKIKSALTFGMVKSLVSTGQYKTTLYYLHCNETIVESALVAQCGNETFVLYCNANNPTEIQVYTEIPSFVFMLMMQSE